MDYFEQLKQEYPTIVPYSSYYDWDNEAYQALEKKNYEKAEQLFKKICVAGPDDFFGFEGLAYVYYTKGDYERAEWFIHAALERAKSQAETGDLDPTYFETLEHNCRVIKERGPLKLHCGDFNPGEASNLFVADQGAWYQNVFAASLKRRYEMVMALISQPLPFEIAGEEEEVDSDKKGDEDAGYLTDLLMDLCHELLRNKEMEKCRLLLEKLRLSQPELYLKGYAYYDRYLIQFALFEGNNEEIEHYLEHYKADPETGIDQLIAVLQLLIYYGLSDQAEALSKSIYHKVKESAKIIRGGERDFEDVIYFSALKRLYYHLQKGKNPTLEDLNSEFKQFEFSMEQERFDQIADLLAPDNDANKVAMLKKSGSGLQQVEINFFLCLMFSKYTLEQKLMDFAASAEISTFWMQIFKEKALSSELSFDEYFKLPLAEFEDLLAGVCSILSNQWPKSAALIWCASHFYDFLLAKQAISQDCYDHAQAGIAKLKGSFIENFADQLWEYSFVHSWKRADHVSEEEFEAERELFQKSYYEKNERKKKSSGKFGGQGLFNLPEMFPAADHWGEKLKTPEERKAEIKNRNKKKAKKKAAKKQKQKERKKK